MIKWLKGLFGVRPCDTLKELCAYIKPGNISGIQYWVSQCIWYEKDLNKAQEWEPIAKILKTKKSDCEEKALISFHVINSWKGWTARLLGVYNSDYKGHAVCAFENPSGLKGYCDDSGIFYMGHGKWENLAKCLNYPNASFACWHNVNGRILIKWDIEK